MARFASEFFRTLSRQFAFSIAASSHTRAQDAMQSLAAANSLSDWSDLDTAPFKWCTAARLNRRVTGLFNKTNF
jgi:hypothetical protein